MRQVALKDVPKGEFFKRKPEAARVYVRQGYDRSEKRFQCDAWDDTSATMYLTGHTKVWIDFEF